ncbi:ArnT family glycosyltransferase [Actinomycetospora soli]|uniref:ArnT family glycosyltransferase n=1 Tax=Actinomycetospora soli TaxID=2893887 RepID=UPI001E4DE4F4|nr:glycosyltransferase family 39 protein [Actinomycetospora soli]MCD2185626.1 glycosyltransferase family 39 protein [Actinomycetospora soli]
MTATLARPAEPMNRRERTWFRPAFAGLLVLTALIDLWDLGAQGDANPFYAAAVQASTRNPVAWLFAAVDAPGFITVDKPPADNWWMGLWANLFGFSPWSMLIPQALLGIGSVALLVLAVRRWGGDVAAIGAGAVLALTPVVVIMSRFDDPDPMLTFLLVAAAYTLVRAVDAAAVRAGTAWMVATGLLVGLGFLAKMGVALLVPPAFTTAFLVAASGSWARRLGQLLLGGVGIVVGAGWFLAVVALWPASERPWIGGSTDDSLLQLAVGYNGLSRLQGRGGGRPGGFAGGDAAGLGRLFGGQFAGQIAWLLPAALVALVALVWVTRRAPRTDRLRAATLLWGGWLIVSGAVFSFMAGTVHSYYTIVMAPAVAALVAIGAREGWRRREATGARVLLAVGVVLTAAWSFVLLDRAPTFVPWVRWLVLAAGLVTAVVLLLPTGLARRGGVVAAVTLGLVGGLGGTTAWAVDTVVTPHTSADSPGPTVHDARSDRYAAMRHGAPSGFGGRTDPAVAALLRTAGTEWSAATPTTMAASALELASGTSVMGLGGFSGNDPTPTPATFESDVDQGRLRYYVVPTTLEHGDVSRQGGFGRGKAIAPIQQWVTSHYAGRQVGSETVYDLAGPRR